jgi:hypothetical protein
MTVLETPVVARNRMAGPTVIASDNRQTHEVIFGGYEDPDGKDVQDIPGDLVRSPQFVRAIRNGILEIIEGIDDPGIQDALRRQTDAFWKRAETDRAEALAVLDQPADNDLIVINCIGPGTRAGAVCGEDVPVRQREAMQNPPLCSRHAGLAEQCMRRGTGPWELLEG